MSARERSIGLVPFTDVTGHWHMVTVTCTSCLLFLPPDFEEVERIGNDQNGKT